LIGEIFIFLPIHEVWSEWDIEMSVYKRVAMGSLAKFALLWELDLCKSDQFELNLVNYLTF
jgi:hypothetical protein